MEKQSINLIKFLLIIFSMMGMLTFQSCNDSYYYEEEIGFEEKITDENLVDLSASDLEEMKEILRLSGIDVDDLDIYASQPPVTANSELNKAAVMDLPVRVIKVTTTTKNPDGSNTDIPISGVLLVPRLCIFPLRIVVATVPTYTSNSMAPSNLFKSLSIVKAIENFNFLYFFTLQATQGFAVLFPDYPGYGDSYGKVTLPYQMKEQLVNSTLDLVKASQVVLKNNKYSYKKELILTGYSLGGYVATALAKELDGNTNLPVKLTVVGGAGCDKFDMMSRALKAKTLPGSYIYPFMLLSYDTNETLPINIPDILKAPYDKSYLLNAFDGTHSNFDSGSNGMSKLFSDQTSQLFTNEFITGFNTDSKFTNLRNLLIKNSIEPWKNKNKIVMIHGKKDDMVYYDGAVDFYNKQKKLGGNISFSAIPLTDHTTTIVNYYLEAALWLCTYK